jgi:hypothetical protein
MREQNVETTRPPLLEAFRLRGGRRNRNCGAGALRIGRLAVRPAQSGLPIGALNLGFLACFAARLWLSLTSSHGDRFRCTAASIYPGFVAAASLRPVGGQLQGKAVRQKVPVNSDLAV